MTEQGPEIQRKPQFLTAVLIIAAAAFAMAAPGLQSFFVSDDFVLLGGLKNQPFWPIFTGGNLAGSPFFRPIALLDIRLDLAAFGLNSVAIHLMHLLLFFATAILAYSLAHKLMPAGWAAFFTTLLFCLHPSHVPVIAQASARNEMLAALFVLAALYVHITGMEAPDRPSMIKRFAAASCLLLLALFSKESYVLAFALFPILTWCFERDDACQKTAWIASGFYFGVTLLFVLVRTLILGGIGGYGAEHLKLGFFIVRNIGYLGQLALIPTGWGNLTPILFKFQILLFFAGIGLIALVIVLFPNRIKHPTTIFGTALFLTPLLPISNLFPDISNLHLAVLGLIIVVANLSDLEEIQSSIASKAAISFAAALLVIYGALSIRDAIRWRDASAIARNVITLTCNEKIPSDKKIYFLSVPDAYKGAFVLRNGLREAMSLFCDESRAEVNQFALAGISDLFASKIRIRSSNSSTWFVSTQGNTFDDYLLLPDASRSDREGNNRTFGFAGYEILKEPERFRITELAIRPDQRIINDPSTVFLGFLGGQVVRLPLMGIIVSAAKQESQPEINKGNQPIK